MVHRRVLLVFGLAMLVGATVATPGLAVETPGSSGDEPIPSAPEDGFSPPSPDAHHDSTPGDTACPRPPDTGSTVTEPRIVELYPNPTAYENVGEYVVVELPPETSLENWTITDGHTTASFPSETVSGRVALTTAPAETRELTDDPIVELQGSLRLAVDGDEIEVRNASETVDTASYERAPTAERWYRVPDAADDETGRWWPRGATCLSPTAVDAEDATTFVLPDSPDVARETIREADDRLLIAGYTVTDEATADELVAAADRGVDVDVLFESGPVGGTPSATESVLETLDRGGVDVRVIGGTGARYRFHHPKYAVADDSVLVASENWNPSGLGGESSRGWGVRIENASLAAELADVFRADFEGWDTEQGEAFRADTAFVEDDGAPPREFPSAHEPTTARLDSVELLVAPDNAEPRLQELLAEADEEILVKQASIDADVSLLEATIDAAHRGVDVRILLDSTWYVEDENEALVDDLERTAADENLSLEARVVDDTDAFEKIHAKGVVIDREVAVVGSANWNENSLQNNREVLLVLYGTAAATYYADVFEADWEGQRWSLPIELSGLVLFALACAAVVGHRYLRFGSA